MSNLIGIALPLLGATVNPNTAFFFSWSSVVPTDSFLSPPPPHTWVLFLFRLLRQTHKCRAYFYHGIPMWIFYPRPLLIFSSFWRRANSSNPLFFFGGLRLTEAAWMGLSLCVWGRPLAWEWGQLGMEFRNRWWPGGCLPLSCPIK